MERAAVKRRGRIALAMALAGSVGVATWLALRSPAPAGAAGPAAVAVDSAALPPAGVRVRVEVLNATATRGLARRATMHLRDLGYDVVASGNADETRDGTLVLQRAGSDAWGPRLAHAMGGARLEARPDSSRHVDLTVLVGRDWRPPPGPLRP